MRRTIDPLCPVICSNLLVLQCFGAAVHWCCSALVLQCNGAAGQSCCSALVLQCSCWFVCSLSFGSAFVIWLLCCCSVVVVLLLCCCCVIVVLLLLCWYYVVALLLLCCCYVVIVSCCGLDCSDYSFSVYFLGPIGPLVVALYVSKSGTLLNYNTETPCKHSRTKQLKHHSTAASLYCSTKTLQHQTLQHCSTIDLHPCSTIALPLQVNSNATTYHCSIIVLQN